MGKVTAEMKQQAYEQYKDLIQTSLESQIKTAFPDSQVGFENGEWSLWHFSANNEKVIDLKISIDDNGRRIVGFGVSRFSQGRGKMTTSLELTKEALESAIRFCIYSI